MGGGFFWKKIFQYLTILKEGISIDALTASLQRLPFSESKEMFKGIFEAELGNGGRLSWRSQMEKLSE